MVAISWVFFQGYSEVFQVSLYLKHWGEEKTGILYLKLFPTFQASGILFIIPLYFYCMALVTICAHIQTYTKAGGIVAGGAGVFLALCKVLVWSLAYPQN